MWTLPSWLRRQLLRARQVGAAAAPGALPGAGAVAVADEVARQDMDGKPLSAPAFQAKRMKVLSKARALWNDLDKTTTERYDDMIAQ